MPRQTPKNLRQSAARPAIARLTHAQQKDRRRTRLAAKTARRIVKAA